MKKIRYRNLVVNEQLRKQLLKDIEIFLKSGQYLMGSSTELFEKKISNYCDRNFAIGVSSGTSALYLALRALNIKKNDEVICPVISWVASPHSISLVGARPRFVDVEISQNINPEEIEKNINKKTKAIMVVHFKGEIANMNSILNIAKKYNLAVIEDASQAFGAYYKSKPAGSFGNISAFSFNPMKVLKGFGEAGCVLTNSSSQLKKIQSLRYLGTVNKEYAKAIEGNYKIDELQSRLLIQSLKTLNKEILSRKKIINIYQKELNQIVLNTDYDLKKSSGYDFQILVKNRNKLIQYLNQNNIETRIKHPILLSQHPVYKKLKNYPTPIGKYIIKHSLSLPLYNGLKEYEIERVISVIKKFYKK